MFLFSKKKKWNDWQIAKLKPQDRKTITIYATTMLLIIFYNNKSSLILFNI